MADEPADRVSVPTLVMTGGPLDGTAYPLQFTGREIIVGSSLDADVQILLGNVESFHSRISFDGGALLLADAGSATGTFVNGEKIEGTHSLQEGDRICLGPPGAKGSAKLVVRMPGSAESPLLFGEGPPDLGDQEDAEADSEEESGLFLGSQDGGLPPAFQLPDEDEGLAPPQGLVDDDGSEDGEVVPPPADESEDEAALYVSPLPASQSAPGAGELPSESPTLAALDDEIPVPALDGAPGPTEATPAARAAAPAGPAPPAPEPAKAAPVAPPAPPAPPPPPKAAQRLTAPPPPPPAAPKPEYDSELPSIPVARPDELGTEPFPPLRAPARPAARPARPAPTRRRPAARRRGGLSLPSLPVIGGLLALVFLAGLVWLLRPRREPPVLASIAPIRIEAGQTVTLSGQHFSRKTADNTVLFGTMPGTVSAASSTELKVVVPKEAKAQVQVTVETKGGRSAPVNLEVVPVATASAVEPDIGMPGQSVLVHGEGFSADRVTVRFAGMPATSVEQAPGGLKVVVPEIGLPEGSATTVTVQTSGQPPRSFPFIVGRLPLVLEAKPPQGRIGEKVVLEGRGFASQPRANAVTVGGQPALVLASTGTTLTFFAPAPPPGDFAPDFKIVVSIGDSSSGRDVRFAYMRSSSGGFPLRFFPAPVTDYPADDLAFVSTELGPALLLSGPAGAGSTAERAAQVADGLNAAIDANATQRVAVELRERPQPSVALVGSATPLLVATAADANAYAKPWSGAAGRRVPPATLARHWAALLQDYVSLFVYRERPLKMLAVSSHAGVLSDIYGEANRRQPGGTSVPLSLVLPTPVSMATALRQMALAVSAEGGRAAAAVEGTWQGTIEDPDRGQRRFRVEVRSEGGRLGGTITTWQRSLELSSRLRDVTFQRGTVRFTADLDGAPHTFEGTIEGSAITGSITRPRREPARFTMQYSE